MQSPSPILSLIIPAYNMAAYLPMCLESLNLDTTGTELEVWVVNDGSTDQTFAVAHEWAARFPDCVHVIDKANGNYGSCVNVALPQVKGRFVKLLDADDTFTQQNLPDFLARLRKLPLDTDAVVSDYVSVDPHGNVLTSVEYALAETCVYTPDEFVTLNRRITMYAVTYRTDLVRTIDYHQTEGIAYTDTEWVFLPFAAAHSIRYLRLSLYRYLIGRAGQTMAHSTWIQNRTMLAQLSLQMMRDYGQREGDARYARRYLEMQLTYLVKGITEIYLFAVRWREVCAYWAYLETVLSQPQIARWLGPRRVFGRLPLTYQHFRFLGRNILLRTLSIALLRFAHRGSASGRMEVSRSLK